MWTQQMNSMFYYLISYLNLLLQVKTSPHLNHSGLTGEENRNSKDSWASSMDIYSV